MLLVQRIHFENHWSRAYLRSSEIKEHALGTSKAPLAGKIFVQSQAVMDIFLCCKRASDTLKKGHLPCVKLLEKITTVLQYEFCRHFQMLSVWSAEGGGHCPSLEELTAPWGVRYINLPG